MTSLNISGNNQGQEKAAEVRVSELEGRSNGQTDLEPPSQLSPRRSRRRRTTKQQYTKLLGFVNVVTYDQGGTTSTSVSITLPRWIYARNFQVHLTKSYQGWDQSFRTYKTVAYDAEVIQYSIEGNVEGLKRLFASGQASPFEVDCDGRTPLHVSIPKGNTT